MPSGASELALAIAVRTSSMASPMVESSIGLTRTRMAGCSAPATVTSATPCTWLRRCSRTVSAASYMSLARIVLEVSARIRIGRAAGLDLRKSGSDGMSAGRSAAAALSAACTSWAAPSMLRLRSNWMAIRDDPREFADVISVMPAISPSRRSSGAATRAAMVSGSAPGSLADTRMVGNSTEGRLATGRKR